MKADAFAKNFRKEETPEVLTKLLAFEEKHPNAFYASGFELSVSSPDAIASWSTEPAFAAAVFPFAQANGSGSLYALWQPGATTKLPACPVIVFGDEGGVHLVAEDVASLLRMLGYDCEPMVDHDGVTFYRGEDEPQSKCHEPFVAWLGKAVGAPMTTSEDVEAAVKAAETKYGESFEAWKKKYLPE